MAMPLWKISSAVSNANSYATHTQAQNSNSRYIEAFYNPILPHSVIGWLSPLAFERLIQTKKRRVRIPEEYRTLTRHIF